MLHWKLKGMRSSGFNTLYERERERERERDLIAWLLFNSVSAISQAFNISERLRETYQNEGILSYVPAMDITSVRRAASHTQHTSLLRSTETRPTCPSPLPVCITCSCLMIMILRCMLDFNFLYKAFLCLIKVSFADWIYNTVQKQRPAPARKKLILVHITRPIFFSSGSKSPWFSCVSFTLLYLYGIYAALL